MKEIKKECRQMIKVRLQAIQVLRNQQMETFKKMEQLENEIKALKDVLRMR